MIWYEDEVKRVEKECADSPCKPETIFYGSSSITQWQSLCTDFAQYKPVNLGFGGSTLAACVWFFDRIMAPFNSADRVIIYAGDNDLGDGRMPGDVCASYRELMVLIRKKFGNIPCYFISIKPSIQRWHIIDRIKETNELIQSETGKDSHQHYIDIFSDMLNDQKYPSALLFESDGLHLSTEGYALWKKILMDEIFN